MQEPDDRSLTPRSLCRVDQLTCGGVGCAGRAAGGGDGEPHPVPVRGVGHPAAAQVRLHPVPGLRDPLVPAPVVVLQPAVHLLLDSVRQVSLPEKWTVRTCAVSN